MTLIEKNDDLALAPRPSPFSQRHLRAKLIFNPISGRPEQSPGKLVQVLHELQAWGIQPEVYLVHPRSNLPAVVDDAIRRGIHLIVICGGDGTVDSAMGALIGTQATLGIIPTGTRNNIATSLDIPLNNIPASVALLRRGRRLRVDVGRVHSGRSRRWFLEICSVGLVSAIFPPADDIQHGNIARIGDLLSTLVAMPPAEMRLSLDGGEEKFSTQAHVVLIANMPYVGANFRVAPGIAFDDGLLDLLVFSNLNKLELIGVAVQMVGGLPEDPRIQHFRVRSVSVQTAPRMPVLADGFLLGEGPAKVTVRARGLSIIGGTRAYARLHLDIPLPGKAAPNE